MENTEKTEKETPREIPVKTEKPKKTEEAEETEKTGARGTEYVRRAARLLLLQMGAGEHGLPVDPLQAMQCLCREQGGVICLKWSEAKQALGVPDPFHLRQRGLDARTVMDAEGSFITVWDDERGTPARRRFTLAHEAGHIALGHFDDAAAREIMSRAPMDAKTRARRAEMEREADAFAAELLCPGVLLRQVFYDCDAATVSAAFDISMQCAEARLKEARENGGAKEEKGGTGNGCSCADEMRGALDSCSCVDEKRRAGEACRAYGVNTAGDGAASLGHSRQEAGSCSHNSERSGAGEAADDGCRAYGAVPFPNVTVPLWYSPEMPRPVCMGDALDSTERALLHRMEDLAAEMPVNGPRCLKCGTAVTRPDQRYCAGCGAAVDLPGATLYGPGEPTGHLTPRDARRGAYCPRCGWAPEKAGERKNGREKNAPGSGISFPWTGHYARNGGDGHCDGHGNAPADRETDPARRCCPECGAPLWNRCLRCGRVWPDGVNHCPDCGMICALGEICRENAGQNRLLRRVFPAAGTFLPEPRLQYARGEALRQGRTALAAALRCGRLMVNDENGLLLAVLTTRDKKNALRHNWDLLDILDAFAPRHPFIGIYALEGNPPVKEIFGLTDGREPRRVNAPRRAIGSPRAPGCAPPRRIAARTGSAMLPG